MQNFRRKYVTSLGILWSGIYIMIFVIQLYNYIRTMFVWKGNMNSTYWQNTHKVRLYLELRLNFSARIGKTRTLGSLHTFLQGPQRQTVDRWDFKPFLKTRRLLHSAKEDNCISYILWPSSWLIQIRWLSTKVPLLERFGDQKQNQLHKPELSMSNEYWRLNHQERPHKIIDDCFSTLLNLLDHSSHVQT